MRAGFAFVVVGLGIGIAGATVVACFNPDLGPAPFACGMGGACPAGYACTGNNLCVKIGNDGGVLPDGVGNDAISVTGKKSCGEVLVCAANCSDDNCINDCRD